MISVIHPGTGGERPAGVAVIAVLCLSVGLLALFFAGLTFFHLSPLSRGAFLIGGGMEQMGPIIFLLYAVLTLTLGWALWKKQRWSRRATILLAAAGIALAVAPISSAVVDARPGAILREGCQIIVRVVVIYYLSQEPVRNWFLQ